MPDPIDFHPLFTQLQSRYPTSSLLCELVQIHEGTFVVRAIVQVGGEILVTSMASAATVEQAEDQARLRVLRLVGIAAASQAEQSLSANSVFSSLQTPSYDLPLPRRSRSLEPEMPIDAETAASGASVSTPSTRFSEMTATALPPLSFEPSGIAESPSLSKHSTLPKLDEADLFNQSPNPEAVGPSVSVLSQPIELPQPTEDAPKPKGRRTSKAQPAAEPILSPSTPAISEPLDLTPLFLQIEGEMERIGWSKEQGRNHLQRTYNKRSRQQLTDDELVDFLNYLKAYPAADDAPFRE